METLLGISNDSNEGKPDESFDDSNDSSGLPSLESLDIPSKVYTYEHTVKT